MNMPLKSQLEYFISKINNGRLKLANGDSAVDVMRVLDLATKSLVKINLIIMTKNKNILFINLVT